MMLDSEIDAAECWTIKSKYDDANTTLLRQRASLEIDQVDYGSKINQGFNLLKHIDRFL